MGEVAGVAEQSARFGEIAGDLGGGPFEWATRAEDRSRQEVEPVGQVVLDANVNDVPVFSQARLAYRLSPLFGNSICGQPVTLLPFPA